MLFSGSQTDARPDTVTCPSLPAFQPIIPWPLCTAPPLSICSVPLPSEPIRKALTVLRFQVDRAPDTTTVPTLPALPPRVPDWLCATPPSRMRSVPVLPGSVPIYTALRLVQLDALPLPSIPVTVRVPTPPLRLPMKAQSLRTDPPLLMVSVPVAESPTMRSPPTSQSGDTTGPGCTSPVLETVCPPAGFERLAAEAARIIQLDHPARLRFSSTTIFLPSRCEPHASTTARGAVFL